jgi:hypothetical protein
MFWARKQDKEDKECLENFCEEGSWETYSWKTEKDK